MYTITSSSIRAISDASQAVAGETVVEVLPQSLLDAIEAQRIAAETTNTAIRQQAETALTGLRAYRDNPIPTNADSVVALKLLCRVAIGLIRLQLSKLDEVD